MTSESLTGILARRIAQPVDPRARRRAVLHWIDWMGCVAAGARAPVGAVLRAWQRTPGRPRATPSLLGLAEDDYHALLCDAGPANVEEMDDMHRAAILHPGPAVIPALAGVARRHRLSAAQTLDALVRGYEVMIRIGRAVGPRHYFFWHNTATVGAFGAAAACASALGLGEEPTVWALGNAGTQAAGLWQVRLEPVMSKQLHTAHAAWSGMTAASLAAAGFTGPAFILEGERGFLKAMCEGADAAAITRAESDWLIHDTSFKPWPACRHTHATIDCVLALRDAEGGVPLAFEHGVVEGFGDAVAICNNPRPTTRTEAKFSLQYAVAATAQFGLLRPEHFDAEVFTRPAFAPAMQRVELRVGADISARYPAHYGARVTLTLAGGRTVVHEVRDSLGDPERALPEAAVLDKARALFAYGGVAPARAEAALASARALLDGAADSAGPVPPALLDPLFPEPTA
ncbi:MAG: MmgE/PrpD family protein [Burkholderiales bacterium]|nr:MmgE/PrpD family protein [Burkholderiales bacterium]